jgi:predicted RNA-binding Zn ribbon-like protein
MATVRLEENLKLESGRLCLDFANTAEWHLSEHPTERLTSYGELVAWGSSINLLPDQIAQQLQRAARQHPAEASRVLDRAVALREAIYHIFVAAAEGQAPRTEDQATLNAELSRMMSISYLVWNETNFDWGRKGENGDLDSILWWVLRSTVDLLTGEDLKRVGVCADDRGCGWLFYDTSRNRTRQWCSMRGCGNRAKARRHYEKVTR